MFSSMMIMCLNSRAFCCFLSGEQSTCSQAGGGGGAGVGGRRGRLHVA